MKNDIFERTKTDLRAAFTQNGYRKIGVGVSGGVDSMVMLDVLIAVCTECAVSLYVLTIDHNMRTDGSSARDAEFVREYCITRGATELAPLPETPRAADASTDLKGISRVADASTDLEGISRANDTLNAHDALNTRDASARFDVPRIHDAPTDLEGISRVADASARFAFFFQKHELARGECAKTARERNRGSEEAARFLRYRAFDAFIKQNGIEVFCTAHNKNDRLETLIQRFLQGSSPVTSAGIQKTRGAYFRPFLDVSRDDILLYARENAIPYRFDSTNLQNDYYRNRIRNTLVPFLNEHFDGWQTGVLHGAEKAQDFADSFNALCAPFGAIEVSLNSAKIEQHRFSMLAIGARITLIYKALQEIGVTNRVPYDTVKKAASQNDFCCGDFSVHRDNGFIVVSRFENSDASEKDLANGFCVTVTRQNAVLKTQNFTITALKSYKNGARGPFALPCVIRSRQYADKIKCANGSFKSLSGIFSDWKVPEKVRDSIPIVEVSGVVRAILGSCCGFKDWIVTDEESVGSNEPTGANVAVGNNKPFDEKSVYVHIKNDRLRVGENKK